MEKNSCSCNKNQKRYGALSSLNSRGTNCSACCDNHSQCRAAATCPECTTCAGSPLYYTGKCGKCGKSCGECNSCNVCNNSNVCNSCNSCNSCSSCSECPCEASWSEIPLSRVSAEYTGCASCKKSAFRCGCEEKHCCPSGAYGVFTASCPISACDGEIIAMEMDSGENSHFRETGGCVHIMKDGVYEVIYSLSLPSGTQAESCLALSLDGQRIYHSASPVESCGAQHTTRYTGHGVVKARRGQRIALHADGGMEIPENYGSFPAVQLTIIRLR